MVLGVCFVCVWLLPETTTTTTATIILCSIDRIHTNYLNFVILYFLYLILGIYMKTSIFIRKS